VVRHACQRKSLPFSQFARRERDTENRGDPLGILAKRLIEIAQPEENDGVRMLALDLEVLVEDRTRLQRSPS
jgi:hypothetical protein